MNRKPESIPTSHKPSKVSNTNIQSLPSTSGASTTINDDNSLDTLPKQFVKSMRTLFDIMDDGKSGFVLLQDIENRWQDDGCKGMPKGVIECLRNVTPSDGLLSFDRFCRGLKICLLQNQTATNEVKPRARVLATNSKAAACSGTSKDEFKLQRPPSAPLLDLENAIPCPQWNSNNTAAVRPNNAMPVTRTHSLPKLSPDSELDMLESPTIINNMYGPPKPPRTHAGLERSAAAAASNNMDRLDKAEIRHALQNWQMGVLMNEMDIKDKRKTLGHIPPSRNTMQIESPENVPPPPLMQKKSNNNRREPRRHTLQNGVDYNMLKRLKHFEDEKDVLFQGLNALERAREWYLNKISGIQDNIKYLGRVGAYTEPFSDTQQERLDLQRARVMEVNRHLSSLADCWDRSVFPMHMNLAVRHQKPQPPPYQHEMVNRLKQQNRQLTDEVSQKSEQITALERERQCLIKELYQQQRFKSNGDETVIL